MAALLAFFAVELFIQLHILSDPRLGTIRVMQMFGFCPVPSGSSGSPQYSAGLGFHGWRGGRTVDTVSGGVEGCAVWETPDEQEEKERGEGGQRSGEKEQGALRQ